MRLSGKQVAIIGAGRGVGRSIVASAYFEGARILAVARNTESLARLAAEFPGIQTLAIDATDETAPDRVLSMIQPDVLVICGGAFPYMAPLQEQTWEQFTRNWNTDVKASFLFCKAALRLPLSPGATVVLISSGAAIGGSHLSGSYAGAKRMQMFLAEYAQEASERLNLGLRFLALVPRRIMPGTTLGKVAVEGYSSYNGISSADFIDQLGPSQTPEHVAKALVELVTASNGNEGNVFVVSGSGIESLP